MQALFKEGKKWSKKENQIVEIEAKVKEGKVLIPEQEEKLASKAIVLKKLEEIGTYYALYKKSLKESKVGKEVENK